MRSPIALVSALACVVVAGAGCDDKPKPKPTDAPTASAKAADKPKPTASQAKAPPTPKALDTEALQKSLKCGNADGPCAVLKAFKECVEFNPVTQSGDGRWLGRGHLIKKGKFIDELTLLRSKRVNLADVGPGQLPAKIGLANIPDDRSIEIEHAKKAIGRLSRGDVPKKANRAVAFIKDKGDWPEAFSMKAESNQIYVADAGGMHLCAKKDQRLLMVRLSGDREHKADGVYATLYPVSW